MRPIRCISWSPECGFILFEFADGQWSRLGVYPTRAAAEEAMALVVNFDPDALLREVER